MMKFLSVVGVVGLMGATAFGEVSENAWTGKSVAFLGDSITDPAQTNSQQVYWQYLEKDLGLKPHVYAVSGYQWDRIYPMAQRVKAELGASVDAIFIFLGTNDYMSGIPLGEWYDVKDEEVRLRTNLVMEKRRYPRKNMGTFRGRINTVMEFLKTNFPDQQIVLMTPPHRGFAQFGSTNIQPSECFPNHLGLYLESYIRVLREAADIWSVPLIDLYRESGLHPVNAAYARYFRDGGPDGKDALHPGSEGHRRLATVIEAHLKTLPPDFK